MEMLLTLMTLQVFSRLKPGIDLSIRHLTLHARYRLSEFLDRPNRVGRDWISLATAVGLADQVPAIQEDDDEASMSRTDTILNSWSTKNDPTIRELHDHLSKLGRSDAVETLLSLTPLYIYD